MQGQSVSEAAVLFLSIPPNMGTDFPTRKKKAKKRQMVSLFKTIYEEEEAQFRISFLEKREEEKFL